MACSGPRRVAIAVEPPLLASTLTRVLTASGLSVAEAPDEPVDVAVVTAGAPAAPAARVVVELPAAPGSTGRVVVDGTPVDAVVHGLPDLERVIAQLVPPPEPVV